MNKDSPEHEAVKEQPQNCEIHRSQFLALYCETCDKLVCSLCILNCCMPRNHKHGFINDMVEKYKSEMNQELEPVRKLYEEMIKAVEMFSSNEEVLQSVKKATLLQLQETFDSFTEILAQKQLSLTESITSSFNQLTSQNSAKLSNVSETLKKLEAILLSSNTTYHNESKVTFLSDVAKTKKDIERCLTEARNLSTIPLQLPDIGLNLWSIEDFQEITHRENFVYTESDPFMCHIEKTHCLIDSNVNEPSDVRLLLNSQSSKIKALGKINITGQLHCCSNGSSETVNVKKITNEKYSLSFVPQTRGKHSLLIKHNDVPICGSPIPVFVTIPPSKLKRISSENMKGINGLRYHGGKLYAAEMERAIMVLDPVTLSVERRVSVPGLGVFAITGTHIYASDIAQHRLIKMDLNGSILASTGTLGGGPGQINFPNGIQVSKDDQIYVSDSNNHRLQVFDKDLNYIRVIGEKGSANGCFNRPADLDFDDEGNVYIVDEKNSRVQVLAPQGQHIRNIGRELADPISITVNRGIVYVTDWDNHHVSVFKTTGESLSTFGEDCLSRPERITIDDNGYVYVSDNREVLFKF